MPDGAVQVGAIARPQLAPERMLAVARAAEAAGLPELWVWEDCFLEGGVASAAAILGATHRLRVGIGVLPFPLRNVALAAMEVATLLRMFPGRVIPGFGHGVQSWMGQVGARPASPLTLEREYIAALRGLLAGDEVTTAGEYVRLDGVRLGWPPAEVPPLLLAATGPRSLELSGEIGDGTIVVAQTRIEELPAIGERIATGRRRAGRDGEPAITVFAWSLGAGVDGAVETIRAWADAGASRVVLEPAEDEPDPEQFVRTAAEAARILAQGR